MIELLELEKLKSRKPQSYWDHLIEMERQKKKK
jgi:hypothetical protein